MALAPIGSAPVVPGMTATQGMVPGQVPPLALLAMLMGNRPQQEDTTGALMEQVIRLLEQIGRKDPRVAPITGEALKVLREGPSTEAAGPRGIESPSGPGGVLR